MVTVAVRDSKPPPGSLRLDDAFVAGGWSTQITIRGQSSSLLARLWRWLRLTHFAKRQDRLSVTVQRSDGRVPLQPPRRQSPSLARHWQQRAGSGHSVPVAMV